MAYDIIGDIHGHAEALKALLRKLGYQENCGVWRHPSRQVIFVGDFIDAGPHQLETIGVVRRMVEEEAALAVMGNHELNAIAWYLPDPESPGEFLRPHNSPKYRDKNRQQHEAFLDEVNGEIHGQIVDWFLTLPLWLDLPGLRVVHACWHQPFMKHLKPWLAPGDWLTRCVMPEACREPEDESKKDNADPSVFKAAEALTKGIEIPLPNGITFRDKYGHERSRVRVRWWDSTADTYKTAAILDEDLRGQLPNEPIHVHARVGHDGGSPIFFGHYWLTGKPQVLSEKVACVDYSIAKGGKLAAYRWDGEEKLSSECFVSVTANN